MRENGATFSGAPPDVGTDSGWGSSPTSPVSEHAPIGEINGAADGDTEHANKNNEKGEAHIKKFRGVPEDVQLFEVFWKQVVELIKVSL